MKAIRSLILPAFAIVTVIGASSAPATAQGRIPGPGAYGAYQVRDQAYENGYRRGYERGANDARSRRAADVRREGDYRNGDWGYERRMGPKDAYKRLFREGFEVGYRDGYSNRGLSGQRRPLPPAAGYPSQRNGQYGTYGPYGSYGSYGTYGDRGSQQVGFNYGYNDGYERGVKAARDRKAFDPYREGWYRDGDRHYDSDYGPRDGYRMAYRDGFVNGYEAGYNGGYYRR